MKGKLLYRTCAKISFFSSVVTKPQTNDISLPVEKVQILTVRLMRRQKRKRNKNKKIIKENANLDSFCTYKKKKTSYTKEKKNL